MSGKVYLLWRRGYRMADGRETDDVIAAFHRESNAKEQQKEEERQTEANRRLDQSVGRATGFRYTFRVEPMDVWD